MTGTYHYVSCGPLKEELSILFCSFVVPRRFVLGHSNDMCHVDKPVSAGSVLHGFRPYSDLHSLAKDSEVQLLPLCPDCGPVGQDSREEEIRAL